MGSTSLGSSTEAIASAASTATGRLWAGAPHAQPILPATAPATAEVPMATRCSSWPRSRRRRRCLQARLFPRPITVEAHHLPTTLAACLLSRSRPPAMHTGQPAGSWATTMQATISCMPTLGQGLLQMPPARPTRSLWATSACCLACTTQVELAHGRARTPPPCATLACAPREQGGCSICKSGRRGRSCCPPTSL